MCVSVMDVCVCDECDECACVCDGCVRVMVVHAMYPVLVALCDVRWMCVCDGL